MTVNLTLCHIIPLNRVHNRFPPISPPEKNPLNQGDQTKCNSNTRPKPIQPPIEPKRSPKTDRHRNSIIAEQLHPTTDSLSSQSTEKTIAVRCNGVEELECSAEGQHVGDEVVDLFIGAEEAGEIEAERGEEEDVEDSDDCGEGEGYFCAGSG